MVIKTPFHLSGLILRSLQLTPDMVFSSFTTWLKSSVTVFTRRSFRSHVNKRGKEEEGGILLLVRIVAEFLGSQQMIPPLLLKPCRCHAIRIVAQEHVGKVSAIVDALHGCLVTIVSWQGANDGAKVRLVEVRKRESLSRVEAYFMRSRGQN